MIYGNYHSLLTLCCHVCLPCILVEYVTSVENVVEFHPYLHNVCAKTDMIVECTKSMHSCTLLELLKK